MPAVERAEIRDSMLEISKKIAAAMKAGAAAAKVGRCRLTLSNPGRLELSA
jgi:hypothetical protein